jgi:predicted nucleic acid-binding protein
MSKLFIDANVLMEIMFARSKMEQVTELFHDANSEFFTSTITVHILYYFAEREGIDRNFVRRLTDLVGHLPVGPDLLADAQKRYDGKDFEDCLQAVCAEQNGCEEIITLDRKFAQHSNTRLSVRLIH